MTGLLLALYAALLAGEETRQAASEPWTRSDGELRQLHHLALAVAATHRTALAGLRAGAPPDRALAGSRRRGAVGIGVCGDGRRMLTRYGPVSDDAAPALLHALGTALAGGTRLGHVSRSAGPPADLLPAGCRTAPGQVWIAGRLD